LFGDRVARSAGARSDDGAVGDDPAAALCRRRGGEGVARPWRRRRASDSPHPDARRTGRSRSTGGDSHRSGRMSRVKATLMLDRARRQEQLDFVRERVNPDDIREFGDHLWVSMVEDQAPRFSEAGIYVQFHPEADSIILPATIFNPPTDEPDP